MAIELGRRVTWVNHGGTPAHLITEHGPGPFRVLCIHTALCTQCGEHPCVHGPHVTVTIELPAGLRMSIRVAEHYLVHIEDAADAPAAPAGTSP